MYLIVGPAGDAQQIRQSSAYSKHFTAKDWRGEGGQFNLRHDALLPLDVWRPWWPLRICVSGHVRKVSFHNGITEICPVPYVKVEIFDVDREACWWPWLRKWWEVLLDRPVIRIPDLSKEPRIPPQPFPGPDPAPDLNLGHLGRSMGASLLDRVALNPQPLPPRTASAMATGVVTHVALNPQPEVPLPIAQQQSAFMRVGEARLMDSAVAARLDKLTLTSKIAPWLIYPHCFYSKVEVCETMTDCEGFFNCCFSWFPFHFRNGRLRYDSRPDIIVKVTQVINGVTTVIYMDPYTSTRWNVTNTHIDLFLDNEEVVCGHGHCDDRPEGSPVFFTRMAMMRSIKSIRQLGFTTTSPTATLHMDIRSLYMGSLVTI